MDFGEFFYAFEFADDAVFDDEIGAKAAWDDVIFDFDWDFFLALE